MNCLEEAEMFDPNIHQADFNKTVVAYVLIWFVLGSKFVVFSTSLQVYVLFYSYTRTIFPFSSSTRSSDHNLITTTTFVAALKASNSAILSLFVTLF